MGDGYLISDEEVDKRDSDTVVVAKPKTQQNGIKSLHDIIQELQNESGAAYIEKIRESI